MKLPGSKKVSPGMRLKISAAYSTVTCKSLWQLGLSTFVSVEIAETEFRRCGLKS